MNICLLIFMDAGKVSTLKLLSFLIEKWKQIVVNKDYGAAILMDLSKAFDTIIMNF